MYVNIFTNVLNSIMKTTTPAYAKLTTPESRDLIPIEILQHELKHLLRT